MNQAFLEEYFDIWAFWEHIYSLVRPHNLKLAGECGEDFRCPVFGHNLEQCNLIKMLLIISYLFQALYDTVVPLEEHILVE